VGDNQSYFERLDATTFRPTEHVGGAWTPDEQHISPMNGLVTHLIEQHTADLGMAMCRLSVDILGVLPMDAPFEITVSTVRPGRTITLVEAVVSVAGRPAVRSRAWLLATRDTHAVAGGADTMALPHESNPGTLTGLWPGGYISSLELRRARITAPGNAELWLRSKVDLLADEPVSELASYVALLDTANGVSVRESPKDWLFPNVDLDLHLFRIPTGLWVGMRTEVVFGPDGLGLTSARLYDEHGAVGRIAQLLTVRER
jgi:hypothetical protein